MPQPRLPRQFCQEDANVHEGEPASHITINKQTMDLMIFMSHPFQNGRMVRAFFSRSSFVHPIMKEDPNAHSGSSPRPAIRL